MSSRHYGCVRPGKEACLSSRGKRELFHLRREQSNELGDAGDTSRFACDQHVGLARLKRGAASGSLHRISGLDLSEVIWIYFETLRPPMSPDRIQQFGGLRSKVNIAVIAEMEASVKIEWLDPTIAGAQTKTPRLLTLGDE
jgi:hypothetical protein